ncbi:MAG: hypothetical protein K2P22_03405 [Lachnospiraceae bacterium]|nr:hypothetical protein [Lachnospiraceae bacterium]
MDRWNRSAPYLAVIDKKFRIHYYLFFTGGLGASSNVAKALLSGTSRQRKYPVAGYLLFKLHERIKNGPLTV